MIQTINTVYCVTPVLPLGHCV